MPNFQDLANAIEDYTEATFRAIEDAEHKTLREATMIVEAMSSGQVSQRALDNQGNPYAGKGSGPGEAGPARGPIPYGDPAIINEQSGQFKSHWMPIEGKFEHGRMVNELVNESRHGEFLERGSLTLGMSGMRDETEGGTARMIKRPILQRLAERVIPIRVRNLMEAMDKVARKNEG